MPGNVKIAGGIWIAFGVFGVFSSILSFVQSAAAQGKTQGGFCGLLIAIAFLHCGLQTVQGKAKDTLGNAIGSLLLSLLYFGIGVVCMGLKSKAAPEDQSLIGIMSLLILGMGLLLLVAGGLAILGRQEYLDWKGRNRKIKKKKKPRPREDDEEEDDGYEVVDEDDRPPSRKRPRIVEDEEDDEPPRRRRQ